MRFARGLLIGIVGFGLWVAMSIFGAFDCIGKYGLQQQTTCTITDMSPVFSIPLVIGFLLMFGAPLYYWIIEPLFFPQKANRQYRQNYYAYANQGIYQQQSHLPPQQYSTQNMYCNNCGTQQPPGNNQYCSNCGMRFN